MTANILILRILFLALTAAMYAVPFFLEAGRGLGSPSNIDLGIIGMFLGCLGIYLYFFFMFVAWVGMHCLFVASWVCLAIGNDWAARRIAFKAMLLAAAFLFVFKPFGLGGSPSWDVLWLVAMLGVAVASICLQVISSHYEELDRRASLVKRWLTHADDSGTWTPAASGERSTSIQELTAPTHSL